MGRSRGIRPATIAPAPPTPSLEPLLQPRVWQGVVYRPLDATRKAEREALFAYAALWVPPASLGELGWGAWMAEEGREAEGHRRGEARGPAERLVGALLLEPHGAVGMVYGPVVVSHPDPFEVASHLLAATLPHATALGIGSLFTRPQGLERLWVRFGFIPVPEAELPKALRGRPGTGLFAWRGGSALWSSRRTGSGEPAEGR